MDPMTMGLVQGGLSIIGGMQRNAAIKKAATQSYNSNKLWIEKDQAIAYENLQYAGDEVNRELGMQLTNLVYEANKAAAAQGAKTAETNVYGNTAARQQMVIRMKEAMAEDNLVQAAEAKMTDVQARITETKYATDAKHAQNAQSYNNAMSQQQSTFDILAGGASAGFSGYSSAQQFNIQSAQAKLLGV